MSYCTACGHPRSGPARYCTACGASLPPGGGHAAPEQASTAAAPPPSGGPADDDPFGDLFAPRREESGLSPGGLAVTAADQGYRSGEPDLITSPPRGGGKAVVATLAAVAVLAVAGGALWLTHRHDAAHSVGSAQAGQSGAGSQGASSPVPSPSPTPAPTPAPTPTPTPTPAPTPNPGGNLVTVAPGVAQDPGAARVEAFLDRYFVAINRHSYRQYRALLDRTMQRDESAQDFRQGYHSSTDSDATLTAISSLSPGMVGAAVTFTSHQRPADSPSHTRCTSWHITLYLEQHGGSYVLGPAPPGYHAADQAC